MDMVQVRKINRAYKQIAEYENYENSNTLRIYDLSSLLMQLEVLIRFKSDLVAFREFGEYTKRFEMGMKELESLVKG